MIVKAGMKLRSAVCSAEFVVVRGPGADIDLACGGSPLLTDDGVVASGEIDVDLSSGSELGKRYVIEDVGIELLCTRAGGGTPTCDGHILELKGAKPLPSSD